MICIVDAPDHATMAAFSMTVGASGAASVKTTVLLTPEEIDRAANQSIALPSAGSVTPLLRGSTAAPGRRRQPFDPESGSSTHSSGSLSGRRPLKTGARIFFVLFVISRYSTSQTSSGSHEGRALHGRELRIVDRGRVARQRIELLAGRSRASGR